ncbi:hypothetical protein VKT23_008442 [Stygiomarasmius scandens]|uniref:DUF4939 domain-containing protein n=1 Tax=Marasmiellus scandens TaxID=2682957 RepID=A0ABR1JH30_9AGAR
MSNLTELVQQLTQQQVALQQQVNHMAEALTRNPTPAPATAAASATPSLQKSSTAKPEPFVGKATDIQQSLSYFLNWASKQNDLPEESDVILSALSYMQGDAADWASCFINQAMKSKQANSKTKFPFNRNGIPLFKNLKPDLGCWMKK